MLPKATRGLQAEEVRLYSDHTGLLRAGRCFRLAGVVVEEGRGRKAVDLTLLHSPNIGHRRPALSPMSVVVV